MISHWFPTWYLEHFVNQQVITTSYEASLAAEWGQIVRDTIQDNADQLAVRVAYAKKASSRWKTTAGGGMRTAGVGGGITGRGAHLLIGDDLFKNWQDASSPIIRERTWNWWLSTAYTRLEPNGSIVLLMTRWHDDDVIGRLLHQMQEQDGERWALLNLPAIAEADEDWGLFDWHRSKGDPLWPERFSLAELDRIQRVLTDEIWQALYQQHPMIGAGQGRVYKSYSEANRTPVQFNAHQSLLVCCDFNVDPMCWVLAQDYGNKVYALDEIALPDSQTQDAIDECKRRMAAYIEMRRRLTSEPLQVRFYGDAAGGQRSTAGKADWALIKEGFRAFPGVQVKYEYPPANPFVKDRVAAVNAMLCNAVGERRLFIDPRCKGLIRDFERVAWKPGTVDLDKRTDKRLTHLSDALGYELFREHRIDSFHRVIGA
jgi:hypothetical protein